MRDKTDGGGDLLHRETGSPWHLKDEETQEEEMAIQETEHRPQREEASPKWLPRGQVSNKKQSINQRVFIEHQSKALG